MCVEVLLIFLNVYFWVHFSNFQFYFESRGLYPTEQMLILANGLKYFFFQFFGNVEEKQNFTSLRQKSGVAAAALTRAWAREGGKI